MCGICGFISRRHIKKDILLQMNDTMIHRGPDDSGVELFEQGEYYIGLAQRRLSILDLSPMGHQPMFSQSGQIAIVFNGEIYNFQEIKKQMYSLGYSFRTSCDTEVIISAYEYWGINCVERFNGMFAFVIYDKSKNMLFCARDRFGKKPFYYYHTNQEFVFASELKPLMQYPYFQRELNINIMGRFLKHGYINAPDSVFDKTYQLEAGHFMTIHDNRIDKRSYWSPVKRYYDLSKGLVKDYYQAKSELSNLIESAVKRRMIADVPLGTFLSGGIDSTLVTAYAQKNASIPVKTYSIGFVEKEYDEAIYSKQIAKYLGTDHHETYIDEGMMLDLVDSIPLYFDEPFADSSQIPTMLVSMTARTEITVALSGDGGDELFCGYNQYDKVLRAQKLDALGALMQPFANIIGISEKLPSSVRCILNNRDIRTKTQIPHDFDEKWIKPLLIKDDGDIYYSIEDEFPLKNWQVRRMLLDMMTYLPGDILTKVDRAAMKYSLETRCPLLDYEVAEYSFRMPHHYKYNKGNKKYILKELAYDLVPKELLDRPKKGFSVPIKKWLMGPLKDRLEDLSSKSFINKQGIFNYEGICNIKANIDMGLEIALIWHFLMFQMWYEHYLRQ